MTHYSIILSDGTIALSRVFHLKQHPQTTGFWAWSSTALAFVNIRKFNTRVPKLNAIFAGYADFAPGTICGMFATSL